MPLVPRHILTAPLPLLELGMWRPAQARCGDLIDVGIRVACDLLDGDVATEYRGGHGFVGACGSAFAEQGQALAAGQCG